MSRAKKKKDLIKKKGGGNTPTNRVQLTPGINVTSGITRGVQVRGENKETSSLAS